MKGTRLLIGLALLLVAVPALAQDGDGSGESGTITSEKFGVEIKAPSNWESAGSDDKAVANFKHKGSQSQIEVVGTKLMTADVASVFFETFHKTLQESEFKQQGEQSEVTVGELEGTMTDYTFTHSGVTLNISIFEFLRDKTDTAWLVVGYTPEKDKKSFKGDFKKVVQNITFKAGESGSNDSSGNE
jgi:hypothetical protein